MTLLILLSVLGVSLQFEFLQVAAFVPFIDGGKNIPKLYEGYFNEQIAKQAGSAVSRAIGAGVNKIEVNFPPVPNLDGECHILLVWRSAAHVSQRDGFPLSFLRGQVWNSHE
jgi:hypothetical protein